MCLWKEGWALGRAKGEDVRREYWPNLNSKGGYLVGIERCATNSVGTSCPRKP